MSTLNRIRLERRRLLVVTVLAFCAGALLYVNVPSTGLVIPLPLLTGALYAGIVGVVALLTCLFFPGFRFMLESIALSRLIVAAVACALPDVAIALVSSPLLMTMLVVSLAAILSRACHGHMKRGASAALAFGFLPRGIFERHPPLLIAPKTWQINFVSWIDQARPRHSAALA